MSEIDDRDTAFWIKAKLVQIASVYSYNVLSIVHSRIHLLYQTVSLTLTGTKEQSPSQYGYHMTGKAPHNVSSVPTWQH